MKCQRWRVATLLVGVAFLTLSARALAGAADAGAATTVGKEHSMTNKVVKTDEEWRAILTPEQYRVLRAKGTEPAFCGLLWDHKEAGDYVCVGCGQVIFSSTNKFHSSSGWPSFWAPVSRDALTTEIDRKFGMVRTEVLCSRCGGHLGHVFDDGPKPTGLRYCINSVAMKFEPKQSD